MASLPTRDEPAVVLEVHLLDRQLFAEAGVLVFGQEIEPSLDHSDGRRPILTTSSALDAGDQPEDRRDRPVRAF